MKASIILLLAALPALAWAVEFDCIAVPPNPSSRPPDCDDPAHPFHDPVSLWCNCLKTGLTSLKGGERCSIEQAIIEVWHQPTIGKQVLAVSGGTLELAGISVDDEIGQLLIDVPIGQAENFFLDLQMVATGVDEGIVDFDIAVRNTNATSIAILTYDPMDEEHAGGLTYQGTVRSHGGNGGFELAFEYLASERLPPTATSTGLELGDLTSPGFSVPVMLNFPTMEIFTLPPAGPLTVETTVDQILTDPQNPVQRFFQETFTIEPGPPGETFRRGDANQDGRLDLSDAVSTLNFLFLGSPGPTCSDAADFNDDGAIDISDPVSSLNFQFLGAAGPPLPGETTCGPDPTQDPLAACQNSC